jgi:hypothetical protein
MGNGLIANQAKVSKVKYFWGALGQVEVAWYLGETNWCVSRDAFANKIME